MSDTSPARKTSPVTPAVAPPPATAKVEVPFSGGPNVGEDGGQTVGKRVMGVRVVRLDGSRLALWPAIKRFIGSVLSIPLFWGYLIVLVDDRRQAFHDKLAGTVVIYYRVPQGELGAFERYPKAIQVRRQAKLDEERAAGF